MPHKRHDKKPDMEFAIMQSRVEIFAAKNRVVVAVAVTDPNGESRLTALTFDNPEMLGDFLMKLLDEAVKVWPDHHTLKEWTDDTEWVPVSKPKGKIN